MNLLDQIETMIRDGCQSVTFAKEPDGACFVQAEQGVATGAEAKSRVLAPAGNGKG